MSQTITNRLTGETLTVYLELGDDLWLRNEAGDIEHAERAQLPADRWHFEGVRGAGDDIPRIAINHKFPPPLTGLLELFGRTYNFSTERTAP
jgi:hypothetical protein